MTQPLDTAAHLEAYTCACLGCGVRVTRPTDSLGVPLGPFVHDTEPPYPHEPNDPLARPGAAASTDDQITALASSLADLQNAVDQLILDNLMNSLGGM